MPAGLTCLDFKFASLMNRKWADGGRVEEGVVDGIPTVNHCLSRLHSLCEGMNWHINGKWPFKIHKPPREELLVGNSLRLRRMRRGRPRGQKNHQQSRQPFPETRMPAL